MTSPLKAKLLAQRSLFQRIQSSKKRSKLQAGFTLIELLIVVVIIGILSAIGIPSFLSQRNKAEEAAGKAEASALARKCAAAVLTDDIAGGAPTADEVKGATKATETTACSATGGVYTGGGITYTVSGGGALSQAATK